MHLSVGLASSDQSSGDSDELIRNADVAMYQAKSKGKARFELFEPQMASAVLRRHDFKEELAKAIEREQMIVQYQPIVALDSGRIVAAEALVRWEHPVRGLVPPAEFVPLAEETGLIVPLGRHVLREACRQARRWQDAETDPSVEPLRMHVNLSVAELRDPGLVDNVLASIQESGIEPGQLVIEITESQLVAAAGVERFHELRELGVKIALDDFGTGYSSLSYLHSLPLDTLKIAKPFIDGLTSGRRESSFVGMIVDLARTLELEVIAEGIETADQLAALRELKAGLGQGYFLGRPSARRAAPRSFHSRLTRSASPPVQGGGGEASVTGGLKVFVRGARERPGDQQADEAADGRADVSGRGEAEGEERQRRPDDEESEQERHGREPRDESVATLLGDHAGLGGGLAGEVDDLTHGYMVPGESEFP